MEHTYDMRRIGELLNVKKANEIEMAKELKSHFNKNPLKSIVQSIARLAIADLLKNADERELGRYLQACLNKHLFWKPQRKNARFPGPFQPTTGIDQFKAIKEGKYGGQEYQTPPHKQFDASDCADVMLVYAEFVEECGKGTYPHSKKKYTKTQKGIIFKDKIWSHAAWIADRREIRGEQQIKATDRRGIGKLLYKKKHRMGRIHKMPKEMHPAFGAKKYVKGQDDYTRLPGETDQAYIRRVTEHRKQLPANKVRVRRKHTEQEQQETLKMLQDLGIDIPDQEVRPGMMFWKLLGESSLMQIDRMFGLKELGADISGTTADTVGVLEALYTDLLPAEGGIIKPKALEEYKIGYSQKEHDAEVTESMLLLRPLISLLPLATMVSLGHHTTLECAYVLSRNEYIDYSIGYYTSLFPINWYNLKTGDTLDYALNLKYEGPSPLEQRYAAGQFPEIVAQVARDIFETLLEYEKKQENAKMMIYYGKDEGPRGAFIIEKKEEKRFRNAATLQKNIDTYLKAFYTAKETRYPSFAVLLETCGKHNLLDELADAHSWDDSDDEPERKYDDDEDPIDERDKVARDTRKDLATFLDPKRKKS